jgi:hypothetical protein
MGSALTLTGTGVGSPRTIQCADEISRIPPQGA